ncbi:MAG TPA: 3'-5' exonuclease [Flavobacteriales bacterium]
MRALDFAIVDVETTQGDPREGRIMEVAVLLHDGRQELARWGDLIRPRVPIDRFVQRMTGIDRTMLEDAPSFPRVASRIRGLVKGRILVAHNARFDLVALQHEFARTGLPFHPDTLCTEKLARQLLPNLQHYNLASLCRFFGIEQGRRHCAAYDAEATLALLLGFIDRFGAERVLEAVEPGERPSATRAA